MCVHLCRLYLAFYSYMCSVCVVAVLTVAHCFVHSVYAIPVVNRYMYVCINTVHYAYLLSICARISLCACTCVCNVRLHVFLHFVCAGVLANHFFSLHQSTGVHHHHCAGGKGESRVQHSGRSQLVQRGQSRVH